MKQIFLLFILSCFACFSHAASTNGTVTDGWLMVEDFEGKTVGDALSLCTPWGEGEGTATIIANPTASAEKAVHVLPGTSYNDILQLDITLPEGKVLADYSNISFDLYRNSGDADNKEMLVVADALEIFKSGYINQAPVETWTPKTYAIDKSITAGNTFTLKFGIKTDAGDYLIDNVKLQERGEILYIVTFDPTAGSVEVASLEETEEDSGVTLPSATPSTQSADKGWAFAGWATAAVQNTTTKPTLFASESLYKPTDDLTLYAVYTDGTNYNSYFSTSESANGTVTDGWLLVDDFEAQTVGATFDLFNTQRSEPMGSSSVSLDPADANERAAHLQTTSYDNLMQMSVTLPTGKTVADYDKISFDFYWKVVDYKKMAVYVDGTLAYEDANYISQGSVNEWTNKVYNLDATSDNTFELALGISTNAGNYYIDNLKLHQKSGNAISENEIANDLSYSNNTLQFGSQVENLTIFNIVGRAMCSATNVSSFDVSSLANGIYIVKANVAGKTIVEKIVRK